jgi:methionyl-tRNA synthetase
MKRQILLTAALPYANGYIHLGHLVEYLQADFWSRFQKMRGHDVAYICADDTHGTAIMIRAKELGMTPKELIAQVWKEHTTDFKDFGVEFAHYSSTDSEENRELCEEFYDHMKKNGHIHRKSIEQLYCEVDKMFLADRFVKGTCPVCKTPDQNGDSCDNCGATYTPDKLINRHCYICKTPPVMRASEQLLFRVNDFKDYLKSWLPQHLSEEFTKKMMEWFQEDLRDWDISRTAPYFGFAVPGETDKYFYVWVDAPMGYVSSTKQWCKINGKNFEDYWKSDKTEVYHFIGKDIVYFHSLFWPALLKTAGYRSPNKIWIHGRLMINGEKMSKSKGTMISARNYLNHLDPTYLRYYYSTKLNSTADDFDLNMDDFAQRVNSELVGKITNLASRGAQMLTKKMDGVMSEPDAAGLALIKTIQQGAESVAKWMEERDFVKATTQIREWADDANKYFDEKAPWKTLESDPAGTKQVLTTTLNVFRMLSIYLKPFIPTFTAKVEKLFNEKPYAWSDTQKLLTNYKISDYEHLATRILPEQVKAMMDESKKLSEQIAKERQSATSAKAPASGEPPKAEDRNAASPTFIEIDDFMKVDLRVAKIIEAEEIKEADKLLRLKVDLGGEQRQIIAGIKTAYKAADLIGRLTVVVANLKPRKMKFGESQGMVLAAGLGGSDLYILSPDSGAQPGQRIK